MSSSASQGRSQASCGQAQPTSISKQRRGLTSRPQPSQSKLQSSMHWVTGQAASSPSEQASPEVSTSVSTLVSASVSALVVEVGATSVVVGSTVLVPVVALAVPELESRVDSASSLLGAHADRASRVSRERAG